MSSKFSREGYYQSDHRESPGLSEEQVYYVGLPCGVAGSTNFEAPTFTCHKCCRVVVMNPNRRRDRAYCAKHDAYLCDGCGAEVARTGECKPFAQVVEEVQALASTNPLFMPCHLCGEMLPTQLGYDEMRGLIPTKHTCHCGTTSSADNRYQNPGAHVIT